MNDEIYVRIGKCGHMVIGHDKRWDPRVWPEFDCDACDVRNNLVITNRRPHDKQRLEWDNER